VKNEKRKVKSESFDDESTLETGAALAVSRRSKVRRGVLAAARCVVFLSASAFVILFFFIK
jgi:hypothetical protein